jgi:hypothetical protein
MMIIMGTVQNNPAGNYLVTIAFQFTDPFVDGISQGVGLVDVVKHNLEFISHKVQSPVVIA